MLFLWAVLAGAALFWAPSPAQAGFTLTLEETGFGPQTFNLTSGTLNTVGPITFGDYVVSVTARDSAPGIDPIFGGALISQNTFTVMSISSPLADLKITVQDNTFSSAPYAGFSQVTLQNSLSTTLISSGTVTSHGSLDGQNTADISLTGLTLLGSVANSASVTAPGGSTFTLGNFAQVHFTGAGTIAAPQQANFTVTTLAPVPAPPSVVLALASLPAMGVGTWLRRRLRK